MFNPPPPYGMTNINMFLKLKKMNAGNAYTQNAKICFCFINNLYHNTMNIK